MRWTSALLWFSAGALFMLLAVGKPCGAHDDAQWIQDHGWRSKKGELCCGVKDCEPLLDGDVKATPNGWLIVSTGERIAYSSTLPSIDGHFWICRWGGEIKCFFAGQNGS